MQLELRSRVQLLGLAGSLRANSYSRAVLRGITTVLPPHIALTICNMKLPLYNEDDDIGDGPPEVHIFRRAAATCDGIIISTPEYNHGIPGVLKNALDWASRPLNAAILIDKPALVMSVSPAFTGGVRAQADVHETLLAMGARIVAGPQVVIGDIVGKIADGRLVDENTLRFALFAIDRLVGVIESIRVPHSAM